MDCSKNIPAEVILQVCELLPPLDLENARQSSRTLKSLIDGYLFMEGSAAWKRRRSAFSSEIRELTDRLIKACESGDVDQFRELIGIKDLPTWEALEKAILCGQRDVVATAIQSGLFTHLGTRTLSLGRTALEVAASLQDSATLEVLMSEKGLELSETCRISALCNAVTVGSLGNFKLLFGNAQSESASLLSAPVDYVLIPEKARQGTLLHAVVALVLQQNRDIWPSLGNTADLAHRRLSILQWFLTKADSIVNATDSAGRNALHIVAAGLHRIEPWSRQLYARGVVNLLLAKKDLNVNAVDAKGSTALHIAAKHRHSTVVASLLSSRELSVNAKNRTGDTALHLASRRLRQYNESIGFVIIELATARTGDDSESAYEVAHWLLMDERVDEVATNADGVTARELAGDNDWTADLFQMHGRHCRSAYGTRTLHFTARSHRNLRNCEIKYTRKR